MREDVRARSDFSALDLNNGNTTVYFVLPPEYLAVHQRALRLVVNTFSGGGCKGPQGQASDALHFRRILQPWARSPS